ncbi:activator of basal transcription 1-like [Xyrauchen texanus]|uniref:activator of basal transcription 1-like n=1 Tax=Xyrauchen texanus TaxID=154827 RepID=UPI002241EC3E|nr:activator of basal transcription 1-like [Xyrauchen texanus]
MALLEKTEVKTDQDTQATITDEELNYPKPEEDGSGGGECDSDGDDVEDEEAELDKDADQEMKSENGDETLQLETNKEDGLEKPKDHCVIRKKKKAGSNSSSFTEGWVEFRDKRIAKRVAASLHNTPMANRKRSRFSSDLWFQWCHLSERLAYEQTVYHQRMRTEIFQAKRETNFYLASVEKSQNMAKLKKKREKKGEVVEEKTWDFKQRPTEEEIQMKRLKSKGLSKKSLQKAQEKSKAIQDKAQSNVSLLAKIFNSGRAQNG